MNHPIASERFIDPSMTDLMSVGTDRVKAYLAHRWQTTFDNLSKANNQALIMYVAIRDDGYEINLASNQVQAYYDMNEVFTPSGGDFIDLVRGYGHVVVIENGEKDIRLNGSRELELGFKLLIGQPIIDHHQKISGILLVLGNEVEKVNDALMKQVDWLATGLEESVRYLAVEEEIDAIRNVDPLTRLVSRDRMMSVLRLEFERSQRSDIPFSMVVIDIDDFKRINETFGHDAGDHVLQEFSEEIAERIRMVDTACRWDGDAFVVLCPQTDLLGANILVNDLFSNLRHHIFPNVGRCFFSMGIADYSPKDITINDMLLRLDKALYRVKAFGGNSHETRYH